MPLLPYVQLLERAPGAGIRAVVSTPPQHGKTETTLHAFSYWLERTRDLRFAYATYAATRSERVSDKWAALAKRAGQYIEGTKIYRTNPASGGSILWTSVGGPLTGEPIDGVLVIDDPVKDRRDASSPILRQAQIDWYDDVADTRLHQGASCILIMTRWHPDDLAGKLVKRGWTHINLKAIADEQRPEGDNRQPGEALWPDRQPLAALEQKRSTNWYSFASLYQGEPVPRGHALFKEPTYYTELPQHGFRVVYGVDLAYTQKTHADFSVCVQLWVVAPIPRHRGDTPKREDLRFYVVDVQRKQVEAPSFTLTLKAKLSERRGRFYWYASGTESGAAQFIKDKGIPLTVLDPKGRDKFTRAQVTAELWNAGQILLPEDAAANPWVDSFADEITAFTGVKDPTDDQVDALVSGIDAGLRHSDDLGILGSGGRYA